MHSELVIPISTPAVGISEMPRDSGLRFRIWDWLNQDRAANFDDYGPRDFAEFTAEMDRRWDSEVIQIAWSDRLPVGIMCAAAVTPRLWTLHGLCFDRAVHGKGIAQESMKQFLELLWSKGAEKVKASYFWHNRRVHIFLYGLGFRVEGVYRDETMQNGKLVDMMSSAIFKSKGGA